MPRSVITGEIHAESHLPERSAPVCGLLSFLRGDGVLDDPAAAVVAALPLSAHRGPDESTVDDGGTLVSGFQRLAVVDLEHSHQPMRWGPPGDPGRYTVVFTGPDGARPFLTLRERSHRGPAPWWWCRMRTALETPCEKPCAKTVPAIPSTTGG